MTTAETNDKANTVAEQGTHVEPDNGNSKKRTNQKKGASTAKKSAKAGAPKKQTKVPRPRKGATEVRSNKN